MEWIGTAGAPSNQGTLAAWQTAANLWNELGQIAQTQYGLKKGIYEYPERPTYTFFTDAPDQRRIFKFLEWTDPSSVFLEMDIFWAYVGSVQLPAPDGTTFDPPTWCRPEPQPVPDVPLQERDPGDEHDHARRGRPDRLRGLLHDGARHERPGDQVHRRAGLRPGRRGRPAALAAQRRHGAQTSSSAACTRT